MTDEQLLELIYMVCDRFVGYKPDDRVLEFLIADWKKRYE